MTCLGVHSTKSSSRSQNAYPRSTPASDFLGLFILSCICWLVAHRPPPRFLFPEQTGDFIAVAIFPAKSGYRKATEEAAADEAAPVE